MMKRESYRDFDATELYCPRCRRAVRVRKRLLLILPQGEKYDYSCAFCGTSVGDMYSTPLKILMNTSCPASCSTEDIYRTPKQYSSYNGTKETLRIPLIL